MAIFHEAALSRNTNFALFAAPFGLLSEHIFNKSDKLIEQLGYLLKELD